jgi:L-alanine-DL-glutamate epimerase-like enolase superfamily enzyme
MKIASIETFTNERGRLGVVRVRSDDGAEGFGEIAHNNADISATILHRQLAPIALGADAMAPDALSARCIEETYKFPGSYVCRALAGLDTALWDLRGKVEGKSVARMVGELAEKGFFPEYDDSDADPGFRAQAAPRADKGAQGVKKHVAVYGSSMRRETTPEQEVERILRARESVGFGAFKLKIGKRRGHDEDEWPGRTESVVEAVRSAVGSRVALLVDANSCYSAERAIEVGRFLQSQDVGHFEEPCPYWEIEWTAEVAAALDMPVAGGEQDTDLAQFRRMMWMGAVDIVQPDVCYLGGFSRALRVAAMAAEMGMPCTPHSPQASMVRVFTLHLLAAIPNAGPFMEYSIEAGSSKQDLYAPMLLARDGKLAVPEEPGWGVTVRPEWLAAANRTVSEL